MTPPRPRNVHHVTYQITEDQTGLPTVRAQCEKFLCYWDAESRDLDALRARVRDHEEEPPADGFLTQDQAREKLLDLGGFIPPGPTPVINTTQKPILVTPFDREPEKAIDETPAPHPFPHLLAEFGDRLPGLTDRITHSLLPKDSVMKPNHPHTHQGPVETPSSDKDETPPKSTGSEPAEKPSNRDRPYTVVELVEEVPEGRRPEDLELVKYTHVLVNGSPVRVARDSLFIDYGDDGDGPRRVVTVSLELQIDELRIGRVPHGSVRRAEGSDQ